MVDAFLLNSKWYPISILQIKDNLRQNKRKLDIIVKSNFLPMFHERFERPTYGLEGVTVRYEPTKIKRDK